MGRSGREALITRLPELRKKLNVDYVIVNGENSAHGFGITGKICQSFYDVGTDCITAGNHVWNQKETLSYINQDRKLLRPVNYPDQSPGQGHFLDTLPDGRKILTIHAVGVVFMEALDNPVTAIEKILTKYRLGASVNAIIIDFHAEATSEKMIMAQHFDGKVSAVLGTHTHIPTADAQILNGGTAFQTDLGMTGDYNSVIGMEKDVPMQRYIRKIPGGKMTPATEEATLCSTLIKTNDRTGLTEDISQIIIGPRLKNRGL